MLAGISEILCITTEQDQKPFQQLLGDGREFGVSISFAIQPRPEGLAQAFIIAEDFLDGDSVMMILGDNIFHGVGLGHELQKQINVVGAHIFTYEVANPEVYGILEVDTQGKPVSIVEKPVNSKSNLAVTGLYVFDSNVVQISREVQPSQRGELEITSVIESYLKRNELSVTALSRGTAWLDTGNPKAMHDAASYVRIIEERTGLKIGCPEEIGFRNGWIDLETLSKRAKSLCSSTYGSYLSSIC